MRGLRGVFAVSAGSCRVLVNCCPAGAIVVSLNWEPAKAELGVKHSDGP